MRMSRCHRRISTSHSLIFGSGRSGRSADDRHYPCFFRRRNLGGASEQQDYRLHSFHSFHSFNPFNSLSPLEEVLRNGNTWRSRSPPFKGRGRGGVCNFLSVKYIETPPPTPPLEGRGAAAHSFYGVCPCPYFFKSTHSFNSKTCESRAHILHYPARILHYSARILHYFARILHYFARILHYFAHIIHYFAHILHAFYTILHS